MERPVESRRAAAPRGGHLTLLVAAAAAWGCNSAFDGLQPAPVTCDHALPPSRPGTAPEDPTSSDFVTVVDAYDMGEIDRGADTKRFRAMGYDLDGVCTGQGQGPSCDNSAWPSLVPVIDGDALAGRDNTQGAVVYRLLN